MKVEFGVNRDASRSGCTKGDEEKQVDEKGTRWIGGRTGREEEEEGGASILTRSEGVERGDLWMNQILRWKRVPESGF